MHIVKYMDTLLWAKIAELIEMQFGMVSQVGHLNIYYMGM